MEERDLRHGRGDLELRVRYLEEKIGLHTRRLEELTARVGQMSTSDEVERQVRERLHAHTELRWTFSQRLAALIVVAMSVGTFVESALTAFRHG